MRTLRYFGLLAVVGFFATMPSLHAQSNPATASGMTMRLMSWDGALTDLWVADGGSYLPVKAGEFVLGRSVFLERKISSLHFFKDQTVDGVTRKQPVADVTLPDGTTSALVVLAPAPAGSPLPFQGRALDQSLEAHPLNTMRVVNFSNLKLALKVGGTTAVILPSGEEGFPFPSNGPLSITVEVAVGTTDGWTMVQRSLQPAPPGRRMLVIARDGRPDYSIQDPALRTKPVDVIFLIDRAPPAPVEVTQK
jgi:hypothetical protein